MKSPTEIINRMCIEKRPMSKKNADKAIDSFAKQGIVMYYYKCQMCGRYHTSKNSSSTKSLTIIGGNDSIRCNS
jgi:hypothetical protein